MSVNVAQPVVVMKRYELKYLMDGMQTAFFRRELEGHMQIDQFGLTSIASLYYDTPDYRLIRTSIEKPMFKEKIRLRSYGLATESGPVYLELKRKAYGIVYKRRVQTTIPLVKKFFAGYRTLVPTCLIIYDRTAYFEPGGDLRLTIDDAPRYRTDRLNLTESMDGIRLLGDGWTILEVKVQDAVPLWLADILSRGKIYKNSFSKYGEAYRQQILKAENRLSGT